MIIYESCSTHHLCSSWPPGISWSGRLGIGSAGRHRPRSRRSPYTHTRGFCGWNAWRIHGSHRSSGPRSASQTPCPRTLSRGPRVCGTGSPSWGRSGSGWWSGRTGEVMGTRWSRDGRGRWLEDGDGGAWFGAGVVGAGVGGDGSVRGGRGGRGGGGRCRPDYADRARPRCARLPRYPHGVHPSALRPGRSHCFPLHVGKVRSGYWYYY